MSKINIATITIRNLSLVAEKYKINGYENQIIGQIAQ